MEHEPGNLVAPTTSVVEAITRADVDIQVATAHRFPRDLEKAERLAAAMACQDQETAESCIYALPRDNKTISGPSIRLAEICASTYGNLRVQSRLVEEGDKSVTAMANAWDLESNYASSIEKRRSIVRSNGSRYGQSMVDTTVNAVVSIAYRDAVFKTIPKAFWQKVYNKAREMAIGNADSLDARRTRFVAYFVKLGVLQENLLASLGREEVKDITAEDIEKLIGAANLIRDGLEDADTLFPPTLPKDGDLAGRIKAAKQPPKSEAAAPDEPQPSVDAEEDPNPEPASDVGKNLDRHKRRMGEGSPTEDDIRQAEEAAEGPKAIKLEISTLIDQCDVAKLSVTEIFKATPIAGRFKYRQCEDVKALSTVRDALRKALSTSKETPTEDEIQCEEMRHEIVECGKTLGDSKMKEILKNHDSGVLKLRQCNDPNKLRGILDECKVAIETANAGAVA